LIVLTLLCLTKENMPPGPPSAFANMGTSHSSPPEIFVPAKELSG
jgi:hypothetical protein